MMFRGTNTNASASSGHHRMPTAKAVGGSFYGSAHFGLLECGLSLTPWPVVLALGGWWLHGRWGLGTLTTLSCFLPSGS